MKNYTKYVFAAITIFLFYSCASNQNQPPPSQPCTFKKGAIQLNLIADSKLNYSDGKAHALHICCYQLKDPNTFNQLASTKGGLYRLLECAQFDSTSVTSFIAFTAQPSQKSSKTLDRDEGVKYFAIVTGYAVQLASEKIIRLLEMPLEMRRKGFLSMEKYAVCKDLNLEIILGPQQIQKIEEAQ